MIRLLVQMLQLCEVDKLEEAEPFMDRLMELFPEDPHVAVMKGLFEYLMEETEDAQRIWKEQSDFVRKMKENDGHDCSQMEEKEEFEYQSIKDLQQNEKERKWTLFDLWAYPLRIALQFNCPNLMDTILTVSEPFFEDSNDHKIDFVLLEHQVFIFKKQYDVALRRLGEAILINDHDVRLWLRIGSTYSLSEKWTDAQEALQRHIEECNEQEVLPNMMGMVLLIRICLSMYDNEADEELLEKAASLMEICWQRIENEQILEDDMSMAFGSFDHRDVHLMNALKYKLQTIRGSYFSVIQDSASALSLFAVKSLILLCLSSLCIQWFQIVWLCRVLRIFIRSMMICGRELMRRIPHYRNKRSNLLWWFSREHHWFYDDVI